MSERSGNYGIGFIGMLQVAFIVLKLCKIIDWRWWQVMLPVIIEGTVIVAILLVLFIKIVIENTDWRK